MVGNRFAVGDAKAPPACAVRGFEALEEVEEGEGGGGGGGVGEGEFGED